MWILQEDDKQLTIRAIPFKMWGLALICLGFGVYFLTSYFGIFSSISEIQAFAEKNITTIIINLIGLLFVPFCGILLLFYFPLTTTKINRQNKTITLEKLRIVVKGVSKYGFGALDGGVRVKAEEDEDNQESLKLYFKLKSGDKIFLSNDITMWARGKAYDVAVKANEFLRPE